MPLAFISTLKVVIDHYDSRDYTCTIAIPCETDYPIEEIWLNFIAVSMERLGSGITDTAKEEWVGFTD